MHTSDNSNYDACTINTIDDSDLGGGYGVSCCTTNLSHNMDFLEEPAILDTTDDVCYAVDVCNPSNWAVWSSYDSKNYWS